MYLNINVFKYKCNLKNIMEINNYSEQFNNLWKLSKNKNHNDINIRRKIGELCLVTSLNSDSLIYMGDKHPYEPLKLVPVSYDGTNEYVIIHDSKCLVYVDKNKYVKGKTNLSNLREIVWPATCAQWLLNGTDDQINFIKKNYKEIGLEEKQLKN